MIVAMRMSVAADGLTEANHNFAFGQNANDPVLCSKKDLTFG